MKRALGLFGSRVIVYIRRRAEQRRPLGQDVTHANKILHDGDGGAVPVGWMWFLAYSTSFTAFISSSVSALILESKASAHGQG
jgi:hypothetical protein